MTPTELLLPRRVRRALGESSAKKFHSTSLWSPIPVGLDRLSEVVTLSVVGRNVLLAGEQGAGKSNAIQLITGWGALDVNTKLYLLDKKRLEMIYWKDVAERYETDLAGAVSVLEDLLWEIERRLETLVELGRRKVLPGDGLDLHLLVIDELASFTRGSGANEKTEEQLRQRFILMLAEILRLGRALGVVVVTATQVALVKNLPDDLRRLFSYRWAFRCTELDASQVILGAGWAGRGFDASKIQPWQQGRGMLLKDEGYPIDCRAYVADDDALKVVAARALELRQAAGAVRAAAP